jgi:hypothetical protein
LVAPAGLVCWWTDIEKDLPSGGEHCAERGIIAVAGPSGIIPTG